MPQTRAEVAEMHKYYLTGHTLAEVATRYGLPTYKHVSKLFKQHGYKILKQPKAGLESKQAIIDFIRAYRRANNVSPSYVEIAVGIGRKETDKANIKFLVDKLIDEGFLEHAASGIRDIVLVEKPPRKRYYQAVEEVE